MLASSDLAAGHVADFGRGIPRPTANTEQDGLKQKLKIPDPQRMGLQTLPEDKRVVLNVGGSRHETRLSTLERLPDTRLCLLAHLQEADESYDFDMDEYYFDRHPRAFESVLQYYRTEELHVDQSLCGNILKAEFNYWGVEEQDIEACCWSEYSKFTEHKETLKDLDDNFFVEEEVWLEEITKWKRFVSRMWRFLEDPGSSRGAKLYAVVSMSFVALSIAIFVLETHKLFQVDSRSGISMDTLVPENALTPTDRDCCCETTLRNGTMGYTAVTHPALKILDYCAVGFFAIEFILRFGFCPNKLLFFRSALNVIDLVCLIPHFVAILMQEIQPENETSDLVKTILMLRIVRILRIFKLMKHYSAFKILVYTIKVSTRELLLMIVFLMSGALMFASIIHFAEKDNFPNIPIAIWWALVTMTTVGYGDKYPVGYIGYGVGSVCVICGVLVIAFTVPIVVNNFSLYYSHAQTRIKIPKRSKSKKALHKGPRSRSGVSRDTNTSRNKRNFTSLPASTPRGNPEKTSRVNSKQNNLNIKEDEKPAAKEKNISRKQVAAVVHGKVGGKPLAATPVEDTSTRLESPKSFDSGYDGDAQKEKKYKQETQRIIDGMVNNDQRFADERKRQEWLIKQKREQRLKAAKLQTEELSGPIEGKESDTEA